MAKQYGTYCVIPCSPDDSKDKKYDLIKAGIDKMIEKAKEFHSEPDFNTLQVIVHEDLVSPSGPDWYEDEKPGYEPSLPYWAITVGIKYREKVLGR